MNTDEKFWTIMILSFGIFLITCVYIGDIAWFFIISWICYAIIYSFYRWYRRKYLQQIRKGGWAEWMISGKYRTIYIMPNQEVRT